MIDNSAKNTRIPPSKHAMGVLRNLKAMGPCPVQEMNFTVRDKLMAFGYIELYDAPSPYKTHKPGRMVEFAKITDAGRSALSPGEHP